MYIYIYKRTPTTMAQEQKGSKEPIRSVVVVELKPLLVCPPDTYNEGDLAPGDKAYCHFPTAADKDEPMRTIDTSSRERLDADSDSCSMIFYSPLI